MKYYKVITRCGHVRSTNYIPKVFYVKAENGREAASKARLIPRVKHNHKFAILGVKEIKRYEYLEGVKVNANDNFLKVQNVQEQRLLCPNLYEEVIKEENEVTHKKPQLKRHLIETARINEWKKQRNYEID